MSASRQNQQQQHGGGGNETIISNNQSNHSLRIPTTTGGPLRLAARAPLGAAQPSRQLLHGRLAPHRRFAVAQPQPQETWTTIENSPREALSSTSGNNNAHDNNYINNNKNLGNSTMRREGSLFLNSTNNFLSYGAAGGGATTNATGISPSRSVISPTIQGAQSRALASMDQIKLTEALEGGNAVGTVLLSPPAKPPRTLSLQCDGRREIVFRDSTPLFK